MCKADLPGTKKEKKKAHRTMCVYIEKKLEPLHSFFFYCMNQFITSDVRVKTEATLVSMHYSSVFFSTRWLYPHSRTNPHALIGQTDEV